VSATPARQHLRELSRQGVGCKAVAEASDVGRTAIVEIVSGRRRRIRRTTRDAILEITTEAAADGAYISASETQRMLRELRPEYMTDERLARALGYESGQLQIGKKRVTAKNEMRVRRLYERTFPDRREERAG
jgi:hypothetical protein